jgi:hypothetical protein
MPRLVWIDAPGTSRGAKHSGAWRRRFPRAERSAGSSGHRCWKGLRAVVVTTALAVASPAHPLLPDSPTSREDAWQVDGDNFPFPSDAIAAMLVTWPQARCRLASAGASMPI